MWLNGVRGDDLGMHSHVLKPCAALFTERVEFARLNVWSKDFECVRGGPARFCARCVVPDVDGGVPLGDRERADPPSPVGPLLVGNPYVATVAVPHPAVERTLDSVFDDTAAVSETCAEMLTVRVQDADASVRLPERDEIAAEVVQRHRRAHRDVRAPCDLKPAGRQHAWPLRHRTVLSEVRDPVSFTIQFSTRMSKNWAPLWPRPVVMDVHSHISLSERSL